MKNSTSGDLDQLERVERSLLSYKDQRGLTPLHGSSAHISDSWRPRASSITQGQVPTSLTHGDLELHP
jgi:hypothetical protein